MKKILLALAGGALIGASVAAYAQAKPAPAAPKGPSADEKAQERAVANYRKNRGMGMPAKDAAQKK
jgi:hypothetical protein